MRGFEYGEKDRKAAILYEYETFKANEGEPLLDTYLRYLQVINDLKKCGYKKDNCDVNDALGYKKKAIVVTSDPLALVAEKTNVSKRKEKVVVSLDSKGSEFDKKEDKKKRDMSKVKCYNCKKKGHFAKDCKKAKIKDYNYYKTKMSLAKKDSDEQVLLAEDQAWMESNESSSSAKETIAEKRIEKANQQTKDLENQNKDLQDKYDVLINHVNTFEEKNNEFNEQIKALNENNDDFLAQSKVYSALFDNDKQHRKQIADQKVLFDKMSVELVELDKHVRDLKNTVLEKDFKIFELEECVCNNDLEIEKCLERLNVCENKFHKIGQTNQTVHMIMPSKDNLYNGRKEIGFENSSYFEKAKDLKPTLYDEKVTCLGYTPMFLTHSDESLEIEKFKRSRENKIKFAYDYGNLNASYVIEKINFDDDYFQEIINPDFEKIDSSFQQTSSLKPYVPNVILEKIIVDLGDEVVEKECDKVENQMVIAPWMFKLSVSQSVSPILMSKMSCESNNVENLDTFSSVRRPKNSSVIWKKKGSSNTSHVDLSSVSHLKLKKNVKRYSRKDLLSCNNSHLGETSSAYVCNDAMNVSCNSRMCDVFGDNNFFIFDDESVRISPVSKMPFRKKPRDSMNIIQICLWIIDSGCSKHMTDNLYNGRKEIGFENSSYFEKAKDLKPTLYDEKFTGLGYTPMFLTHSDESLEIEKFKRSRENKIKFAYDYGNLNASYVNEKINFDDDYFQEIINPDFEKIDSPFQQTSSLKPYVPNVILEKIIVDLGYEVVSLLEK
nr:hypothetical protein [Tanacetum cinerariifolium]